MKETPTHLKCLAKIFAAINQRGPVEQMDDAEISIVLVNI